MQYHIKYVVNLNNFRAREAKVNYYNAGRQHAVNAAAEYKGAGTGTAYAYGVPGKSNRHIRTWNKWNCT